MIPPHPGRRGRDAPATASDGRRDRGQTMVDFVVAMGIFLLTVGFVVAFVAGMTVPYEDQQTPLVAERVASDLADDRLAESPAVLDERCTLAFFGHADATGCPFDAGDSLNDRLGVAPLYSVNVTLRRNVSGGPGSEILCGDGGSVGPCGSDRLAAGPSVPDDGTSVATARRAVHVDGQRAILEVRVW